MHTIEVEERKTRTYRSVQAGGLEKKVGRDETPKLKQAQAPRSETA